jgi:hypothetical protein
VKQKQRRNVNCAACQVDASWGGCGNDHLVVNSQKSVLSVAAACLLGFLSFFAIRFAGEVKAFA